MASGYAIGGATGGSGNALIGANVARDAEANNRQLHPDERRWIKQNAEKFAEQQGISTEEATERLAQQAARQTDALWFLALSGGEDSAAKAFLATANKTFTNESGKAQQFFTTQGKDFIMPQRYAPDARMDLDYYDKYLIKGDNNKINDRAKQIVADKAKSAADTLINDPKQAAKNTGKFAWGVFKGAVVGTWDCVTSPINCASDVKDGFVENANAIGTGAASMKENDLQRLYGQDTRTAQGFILAGNLTEAGLTTYGGVLGKRVGGATVKAGEKAAVKQAEKKAAEEAAENARKAKQAEINAGLDGEMVSQPQNMTGKFAEVRKVNVGTKIDDKVVLAEKHITIPQSKVETFKDFQYVTVTSTEEIKLYRGFGGTSNDHAKLNGSYATTESGLGRQELAVYPKWISTRFEAELVVPKGETFSLGFVGEQPVGGKVNGTHKYRGGADQIFFQQDAPVESWVKSVTDRKTGKIYSLAEFKKAFPDQIERK